MITSTVIFYQLVLIAVIASQEFATSSVSTLLEYSTASTSPETLSVSKDDSDDEEQEVDISALVEKAVAKKVAATISATTTKPEKSKKVALKSILRNTKNAK